MSSIAQAVIGVVTRMFTETTRNVLTANLLLRVQPEPTVLTARLPIGPKLSAVRREMLLQIEYQPTQLCFGQLTTSQQVTRRRAAHAMAGQGLLEVFKAHGDNAWGSWCPGMLWICITPKGRAVLATYRHEFENGGRIRWSKFEHHATG